MAEAGVVRVSAESLANWKAQIDQAYETYNTNDQRVENVIQSIRNGDMTGDPAEAFLKSYEEVAAFLNTQIPKKFEEASGYLAEQMRKLGVLVDNIQAETKW